MFASEEIKRKCNSDPNLSRIEKSLSFGVEPGKHPVLSKYLAGAYFSIGNYSEAEQILVDLEASFSNDPNFLSLLKHKI